MAYSTNVADTKTTYRLSSRITTVCRDLIDAMMKRGGIGESAVIELAVRERADRLGITYPDADVRAKPTGNATKQPATDSNGDKAGGE